MKKPTIIFAVQLPPPVHGSSVINELIVSDESINQKFNVIVQPIQMANEIEDMGSFSIKKLFNTFNIFIKQIVLLTTKSVHLYYIALSPINFAFYKDFILVVIAKMFNRRITIHLHGQGIKEASEGSILKRRMYQYVFKNTQVICLAKPLFEDIKALYEGTPHFLSNGIKAVRNLSNSEKDTTFLYLSNLMKEKGIELFLQALLNLHLKGLDFKAEIIGSSGDYTIQQAQDFVQKHGMNKKVDILGPIYGKEKYDHFAKAKVFVLPSFQECFPLTILEAFQSKCAVIATNTGGISEIVENDVNGFVVKPKEALALEEKMELFIKDATLHKRMGELNFTKFEQNYTQQIFIDKLITILESNLK